MNTKTILITGGTTGIGLATAQLLSAEGAKVIVTGRNPETLASAKKILSGVAVHPSDSGDLAAAQALGDEIKTFAKAGFLVERPNGNRKFFIVPVCTEQQNLTIEDFGFGCEVFRKQSDQIIRRFPVE